jgi:diguanylate cyclase (GGDEF)-like protein/PAS domain S-box-containing protein
MLAGNLAVVALFVLVWSRTSYWLKSVARPWRDMLFAATISLGTLATMSMGVEFQPGLYFDLRHALLAVAALFGGWPAAVMTTVIASIYRASMGGGGVAAGLVGIGLASSMGLLVHYFARRRSQSMGLVIATAVLASTAASLGQYLALPSQALSFVDAVVPNSIINALATAITGIFYLRAYRLSAERELMATALFHAPDYAFVKDADGRFVAANDAIARFAGLESARGLIGRTCMSVMSSEAAAKTQLEERAIMNSGQPMVDQEEQKVDASGQSHWYSTTKVPLRGPDGKIIGMAGVMRDVTADKILRQELLASRDTLSYALSEMNGGIAMIDADGHLIFCNDRYRNSFPYTGHLRVPGADMRDILAAVIETGEQLTAPKSAGAGWVQATLGNLLSEHEEEINLFDGTWLQVRSHTTSNGTSMVLVSDVTRFKQAQKELNSATDQLKQLARTDGLTDLLNRRAFDEALENEIRRGSRSGAPLSLLMIDVDLFKAFNDHYGHPAGDECLRQVSQLLRESLKRPADLAARYGGEEFAAILPDTDEDGAYLVADAFRRAVSQARIPHEASERGYVTASVGVATYMPDNVERSALELAQTADGALYSAKAAGRDRVFGTQVARKEARYAPY